MCDPVTIGAALATSAGFTAGTTAFAVAATVGASTDDIPSTYAPALAPSSLSHETGLGSGSGVRVLS